MKNEVIENEKSKIFIDENHILNIVFKKSKFFPEDIENILDQTYKISINLSQPFILNISESKFTIEARKKMFQNERFQSSRLIAILVSSFLSKIIENFFVLLFFNKKNVHVVNRRSDATNWVNNNPLAIKTDFLKKIRDTFFYLNELFLKEVSGEKIFKNIIFTVMNLSVATIATFTGIFLFLNDASSLLSSTATFYGVVSFLLHFFYREISNIKIKGSIYVVFWLVLVTFMAFQSGGGQSPVMFAFLPLSLVVLIFFSPLTAFFWMMLIFADYYLLHLVTTPSQSYNQSFLIIASAATFANFCIGNIFNIFAYRVKNTIDDAIGVLSEYAAKRFDSKMDLTGSEHYDALAFGINILGEELASTLRVLKKYQDELEMRVEMKTKELQKTQADLVNASKFATLGEISGGIAHEINNPLAAIILRYGHIRYMLEQSRIDGALKIVEESEKTARKIEAIVAGLRNFSRSGEKDPFKSTSIKKIVEDSLFLCQEQFYHHGVELDVISLKDDVFIECNEVQISQVILNLLTNAKQAIESISEKKWIKLELQDHSDFIRIEVTDCGHGIPSHLIEKIMQPFFTTKDIGQGTGLGLSISKSIAEKHRGRLFVDTECQNTRFVLELPKKQKT